MLRSPTVALLLALAASPALAAPADHPVKVSTAQAMGPIFEGPTVVTAKEGGAMTKWFEMMSSPDKKFSAGTYTATASRNEIASYTENEFMFFLKGGVTLTSADGTVTEVKAGDGVTIPKGWKGVWDTKGYTKFYVTYDPDAPVQK
jgi:ethanolamine utilization protein EutQ